MQKKLSPWCKKAKIAMIQNDISVNDLAEELGCSRCYLSSTLNGKNTSIEIRRKGTCPLCGSQVTIKAKGRMPRICDERTVSFIEPREDGFLWRYFRIRRWIGDKGTDVQDHLYEIVRTFYKFAPDGTPCTNSYEWREYKQRSCTSPLRWNLC